MRWGRGKVDGASVPEIRVSAKFHFLTSSCTPCLPLPETLQAKFRYTRGCQCKQAFKKKSFSFKSM